MQQAALMQQVVLQMRGEMGWQPARYLTMHVNYWSELLSRR